MKVVAITFPSNKICTSSHKRVPKSRMLPSAKLLRMAGAFFCAIFSRFTSLHSVLPIRVFYEVRRYPTPYKSDTFFVLNFASNLCYSFVSHTFLYSCLLVCVFLNIFFSFVSNGCFFQYFGRVSARPSSVEG